MKNCRVLIASKEIEKLFNKDFFSDIPHRFLKKGEICYPNSPRILILKEGELKISLYDDSKELILYFLHKNNFCLCNNSVMVQAKADSEFYFLDAGRDVDLFHSAEFCNILLNNLHMNMEVEREIMKSLAFKSSKKRICDFLLELASSVGEKTEQGIMISIDCTMEEISSFLGMSRQRFSTFINEMTCRGILKKPGQKKFLIKDLRRLKQFAKE